MLRSCRALAGLLLLLVASLAQADAATDAAALVRLERSLATLDSARADFVQQLYTAAGEPTDRATGVLYLKKPGRFRWDYAQPRQLIVSDGMTVSLYDPELEQVTVRPVRGALSQTPAMLLTGEARVRDQFTVRDGGQSDGVDWVLLTPRLKDTDFRELKLGFVGDQLHRLEFTDALNQRTRIDLSHLERNARLADTLFQFVAPPGVDVIGAQGH